MTDVFAAFFLGMAAGAFGILLLRFLTGDL